MEPRKDDAPYAGQSTVHGSSSSTSTSSPVPEYPATGTVKPVLNFSIQTGEEFALEFMRDRTISKKPPVPVMPRDQTAAAGANQKSSRGILGAHRTGAESRFDASIYLTTDNQQAGDFERRSVDENENRTRHVSTRSAPRAPSSGGSSHGLTHGYASSGASDSSRKIKILCSFGGKILPRPSDGKLRYAGGETRIIRINRNTSWQELKQKTTAIYNQPHTIKYQLPGEDLDALISVSNDEDLRNMMEECAFLDSGEGSQKLRIFLVSSVDFDDMNFSLGSMDSDSGIQYVVAINGMDMGAAKPSSGHALVNTSISEFDQFINFNVDINQADLRNHGSSLHNVNASTSTPPAMMSRPVPVGLSGDNSATLYSYLSHGIQNVHGSDYSYPTSSERFNDNDDQMSIPLSGPSDFRYASQYAPYSGTASLRSFEQQFYDGGMKIGSMKEEKQDSVKMPLQKNGLDYFESLDNLNAPMLDHDSSVPKFMHSEVPPIASVQEGLASSFHPSYSAKSLDTYTASKAMSPTQGSECNEDDRQSSEAFASGCSEFQVDMSDHSNKNSPPHPGRVFHSDWIPREQAGVLNRLSKSDDPLNSQILILQSQSRVVNEPIAEAIDPAVEGNEKTNLATWAINFNDPATVDSLTQFEKEYSNTAHHTSFNKQLVGEKMSSKDMSMHTPEKIVARGKPTEITGDGIEAANLWGDHADMGHHFSRDTPKPALSTDVECDLVVPSSTSTVNDSHKEPIVPKTDKRDIAGGTAFIPSQTNNAPAPVRKNVEGLQVDNPFPNMHEMMPSVPEFEETTFEEGRAVGPVMDASFVDNDFEYLQIIKNEDLEELRELGSGTFGTVYHGKWRGSDVAIKRIKKSCFAGRSSELERLANEFWREAEILSKLHHPNVVAFYGVVKDGPGGTLATVTEFMVNGSLRHVLQRNKNLDRRKRLIIAMDAAFGLEYLHSKNIVHFDLKCDNLLVNLKDQSRPICKVGDFGLSKIKRNTLVSGGVRGTLPWMAPELLNGGSNKVSEKVDVFSFGIVMWEILTGEEPYANMHYGAIIGGIVNNTLRPHVPASCDPEWRRLMEQCWAPDPAQRPAFTEIAGRLRSMSVAASQAKASSK
ncbi:hypothetical protein QYE76_041678 [Lolium multiflorum]|uniref:Protein kinase domain-containing protein n=1 Tax=Lolium multiflorum TaxID=4521 RepID=A0AAD8TE10_LOLMU|nr:hypothetical protein QYE76_041678 [Lolium multiflorum]